MRKILFIKKLTVWSLCVSLILPAGAMAAEGSTESVMTENTAIETTADGTAVTATESPDAASEDETAMAATESPDAASEDEAPEGTDEIAQEKENTGTGYMLKRFTLYDGDEATVDIDSLRAELDFATVGDISGVRLLIDSKGTEAGYIAVSYIDNAVLIVLHGGLSGETVKYKLDSETLTTILDSNAFNLFLRGTADDVRSSVPEEQGANQGSPGGMNLETGGDEDPDAYPERMEPAGQESEEDGLEDESDDLEMEEPETGEAEPEMNSAESEGAAASEPGTDGLMINGLSLTSFVRLVNEAYLLINESVVKNEKVTGDQGAFHQSGIVLDRDHMNRLLEIFAEMGIDGGVKTRLDAQDIRPEGGAFLWGTNDEDYKEIAGSFGISVEDEEPVWNAFGADIVGRELVIYNYRMPEQQGMEIENGMEIVFDVVDPKDGTSWVPVDDTDAIDLAKLEPAEAIEEITADIQMVLYDMMGGVLSVVLEEVPEEMVSDMLGLESGDEEMSESESEAEINDGVTADTDTEDGSETEIKETDAGAGQTEEESQTAADGIS